ncbi:MAG: hypothetical protein COA78_18600 [Blastopirellula sp.]|nr:MAG: hypothetical protein COA78_18600 [Blastopirellula sp.]
MGDSDVVCWNCGTSVDGEKDSTFVEYVDQNIEVGEVEILISKACPKCESSAFKTVRPENWVAFKNDHICLDCNTRYSLPTPIWASLTFLALGLFILVACIVSISLRFRSENQTNIVGAIPEFGLAIIGLLAIKKGYSSLW